MKKTLAILAQIVIVLVGIAVFVFLILEPQFEGVNVGATLSEIYFNSFIIGAYLTSIAFFVGLYQAFKLLGFIGNDQTFSQPAVKAARIIKYCALILIAALVYAEGYLFVVIRGTDDIVGGVAMGLYLIICSIIVAIAAVLFERRAQKAGALKF